MSARSKALCQVSNDGRYEAYQELSFFPTGFSLFVTCLPSFDAKPHIRDGAQCATLALASFFMRSLSIHRGQGLKNEAW